MDLMILILKSYFDNGSVLIMPYFKNDIVERFIFTFEFDFIDDDLINLFLEHYNSLIHFAQIKYKQIIFKY